MSLQNNIKHLPLNTYNYNKLTREKFDFYVTINI